MIRRSKVRRFCLPFYTKCRGSVVDSLRLQNVFLARRWQFHSLLPHSSQSSVEFPLATSSSDASCKMKIVKLNRFPIHCAEEQEALLHVVLQGAGVFIGGNAGTGKSFFLRRAIEGLRGKGLRVAVTASTGVASLNIGGNTFHSVFGVSSQDIIGKSPKHHQSPYSLSMRPETLLEYDVIVVDEVSYLDAAHLELLDECARKVRKNRRQPFGGIQMILAGDFLQLSVVGNTNEKKIVCSGVDKPVKLPQKLFEYRHGRRKKPLSFYFGKALFDSPAFQQHLLHVQLLQVHRHKDPLFLEALNRLRIGELPTAISRSCVNAKEDPEAIRLFARRKTVKEFNDQRMLQLEGNEYWFPSDIEVLQADEMMGDDPCEHSHIVVVYMVPSRRSLSRRLTPAVASRIISKICSLTGIECDTLRWMILPFGSQGLISRLAIRCRSTIGNKAKSFETLIIYLSEEVNRSKEAVTCKEKHGYRSSSSAFCEWLVLSVIRRNPIQFNEMIKSYVRESVRSATTHDYSLCNKRLKKGCRVMVLRNLNTSYVNGSLGTVVGFAPKEKVLQLLPSKMKCAACLRYGSKGQFFSIFPDFDEAESAMEAQEGESGCNTRKTIKLNSGSTTGLEEGLLPLVRMDADKKVIAIPFISVKVPEKSEENFFTVQVVCLPLTPAFAFTVHKVQGITFSQPVLFDAKGLFPCNHLVYVAASRVTRLEYLRIINLSPTMVTVHSRSLAFSFSLQSVSEIVARWVKFCRLPSTTSLLYLPSWTKKKRKIVLDSSTSSSKYHY